MTKALNKECVGLLVVDLQEKLLPFVERSCALLQTVENVAKGFQILQLPIVVVEQNRKELGKTPASLKTILGKDLHCFSKTSFSCIREETIRSHLLDLNRDQWILVGIEAHISLLQTARDLLQMKRQVVVLNDAISSRSIFDYSTAIAELRDLGVRISSAETILFELIEDSAVPEFQKINQIVRCLSC